MHFTMVCSVLCMLCSLISLCFSLGSTPPASPSPSYSNQSEIRETNHTPNPSIISTPISSAGSSRVTQAIPNENQPSTSADQSLAIYPLLDVTQDSRDVTGQSTPLVMSQGTPSQPRQKWFPCLLCFNTFTFKSHLDRHMLSHTNERPFKCKYCGKSSNHQGARDNHQKICQKNTDRLCPWAYWKTIAGLENWFFFLLLWTQF